MRQWRTPLIMLRKARVACQSAQPVETRLGARAVVLTVGYVMVLDVPFSTWPDTVDADITDTPQGRSRPLQPVFHRPHSSAMLPRRPCSRQRTTQQGQQSPEALPPSLSLTQVRVMVLSLVGLVDDA